MPPEKSEVQIVELPASITDFASAAGLAATATKSDVLVKISKDRELASTATSEAASVKSLLDAIGATSVEGAVGKLSGERASHLSLVKAVVNDPTKENATTKDALDKLGADRKAQDLVAANALIADARAGGKTVGDGAMAMFESFGMTGLKAHIDALVPNAALVSTAPKQPAGSTAPASPGATNKDGEIAVKLTAADEKMIKEYGLNRDQFIATRRADLQSIKDAHDE